MDLSKLLKFSGIFCLLLLFAGCEKEELLLKDASQLDGDADYSARKTDLLKGGKPDGGETAGNNLSFPVIWSDGIQKVLPGTPGIEPILNGEYWYN